MTDQDALREQARSVPTEQTERPVVDWMAAADAEYDALPGTPPDGWSFIDAEEMGGRSVHTLIRERLDLWKAEGMTFARITDRTGEFAVEFQPVGIWIEVWKAPPHKQAEFDPPLVLRGEA